MMMMTKISTPDTPPTSLAVWRQELCCHPECLGTLYVHIVIVMVLMLMLMMIGRLLNSAESSRLNVRWISNASKRKVLKACHSWILKIVYSNNTFYKYLSVMIKERKLFKNLLPLSFVQSIDLAGDSWECFLKVLSGVITLKAGKNHCILEAVWTSNIYNLEFHLESCPPFVTPDLDPNFICRDNTVVPD